MIILYFLCTSFLLFIYSFGSTTLVLGVSHTVTLSMDAHSFVFLLTLFIISSSVLLWSYYYIDTESSYSNFCGLVLCFLFSIFGLVLGGSLLTSLVFWDLLGFSSFFLVIYPRSRASLAGGLLTGLTNRLGDIFLLFLFAVSCSHSANTICASKFFIAAAAITKSAQAPFSAWLPSAIVAPTPVSALVHSSTLVTAGVYLIFRFTPSLSYTLLYIGLFTSFLAGLAASSEWMIKNIVALSTLSQLGFIITALGLGQRSIAFFHLNTHAAFKALLFLAVGVISHSNYGSQQLRLSVNAFSSSCLVGFSVLISIMSLCGIFFLSGWASKDSILEAFTNNFISGFTVFMLWVSTSLTLIYSYRLLATSMSGINNFLANTGTGSLSNLHSLPLVFLCCLAVIEGYIVSIGQCLYAPVLASLLSSNTILNIYVGGTAAFLFYKFGQPYFSPWVPLMHSSSLGAGFSAPSSSVIHTENSCLQAAGVSALPLAVLTFSSRLQAFRIFFILMALLAIIF